MKTIKELMGLEEAEKMKGEDPCWPNYEMIGTKPGKDGKPVPNCVLKKPKKAKPKNEEVEQIEESATVLAGRPTTHAEHHYSTSAGSHPASHVEKTLGLKRGSISKDKKTYIKHGDVHVRTTPAGKHVHVSLARKHGKFGQDTSKHDQQRESLRSKLLKTNEEVELEEASDTKRPPNFTMHPIDRQDYKILRPPKKTPPKGSKEWGRDGGEKKIKEETEQIDELNKDTLYSYNKKADADIEKKHKSLGQLMRRGDAAGANKAAHQINRRLSGMERAEKRLNTEEAELGEEEVKKVKMTPQERAYKRKLGQKAVSKPVAEAAKVETAAQVTKHFEKGQSTPSGVPKWVAEPLKKKKKVEEASDAELMGGAVSKPTASGNNPKLADKFMKAFRKMKSPANISCKTVGMISTCEDVELDEAAKKKEEIPSSKSVKKGEKLSGKQEPINVNPELQQK